MASYAGELTAHLAQALTALAPSLVHPSPAPSSLDLAAQQQHEGETERSQDDIDSREHTLRRVLARLRSPASASSSSPRGGAAPASTASLSAGDLAALVNDTFPPFQGTAATPLSPQTETVELVTLAQLTIHAYGLVLRTLIDHAARLDADDDYWTRTESAPTTTALYLVQTTPARALALAAVTTTRLRALTRAAANDHQHPSLLELNTWRRALPPALFLTSVFPHLERTSGLPSLADLDSADRLASTAGTTTATTSLSLSSATRLTRHAARSLVFLTLSPLALTRQEIAHRREGIRRARDDLALRIGELTLAATLSDGVDERRTELPQAPGLAQLFSSSHAAQQPASEPLGGAAQLSLDEVRAATWQTLVHLDAVLTPSQSAPSLSGSTGPPQTPADLAHALAFFLAQTLPSYTAQHAQTARALRPPGVLARAWPTLVAVPLLGALAGRAVYARRAALAQYALEAAEAARGFVLDWVVEPVRKILDTLRGGEDGVALMGRESLRSDWDSLERMVLDFGRDEYKLGPEELAILRDRVRAGDLTPVLKAWEKDIKSPIRSAVSGSLIRTLLIQVQKVKVDVALAMDGIEKMLKSQQLTFGFVGVAPSMLVLAVLGRWVRGVMRSDGGRKQRGEGARRCWMTVRQLDLLLSPPRSSQRAAPPPSATHTSSTLHAPPSAALTQGNLILSLSTLRSYAASPAFPTRDTMLRAAFLEDVRAVEREGASVGAGERRVLVRRLERWGRALGWDEGVRA